MPRPMGLPLPGSVGPFARARHAVAYWCPALRAGAGGWYVLGHYTTPLHAAQGATLARAIGYTSATPIHI